MDFEDQEKPENANLNNPQTWIRKNERITSVSIDVDIWKLAKQKIIPFKKAMEFGILFLVAELEQDGSHPQTSLHVKISKLIQRLEAKSQECEALRKQTEINEKEEEEDLEKEMDEILNSNIVK